MVPLGLGATDWVTSREEGPHRTVAIHHAMIHRRPGLWGDHPSRPTSVVLVREVGERCDVFGAGRAGPAVVWLAEQNREMNLLAPIEWEPSVRRRPGKVERGYVQTWFQADDPIGNLVDGSIVSTDEPTEPFDGTPPRRASSAPVRRLADRDVDAFLDIAPDWALWSWGSYARMIADCPAFGVPTRDGRLASIAWIFEEGRERDKVGVATAPRYQRLGLGRVVAEALVNHIRRDRGRLPIWSVGSRNLASQALARSLGFVTQITETVLHWTPRS